MYGKEKLRRLQALLNRHHGACAHVLSFLSDEGGLSISLVLELL